MPELPLRMGAVEWALLLILSVLWGATFIQVEIALDELGPLTVVLARVCIAAVVLVAVLFALGERLPADAKSWAALIAMGVLNNFIPFSLIFWAQTRIDGGLAAILNATTPLFTVVLAHVLTRDEKLSLLKLVGVALGMLGVAAIIGLDVVAGADATALAGAAILGASASYALAGLWGRRFSGRAPIVTAAGQLIASSCLMLPLALAVEEPWHLPTPTFRTVVAVLGLATLSTALAYVIYFRILAKAGATNLLLVTFLIPASAVLLGWLILDERLEPQHFAGMALIALGLAAIDGRLVSTAMRRIRKTRPDRLRAG